MKYATHGRHFCIKREFVVVIVGSTPNSDVSQFPCPTIPTGSIPTGKLLHNSDVINSGVELIIILHRWWCTIVIEKIIKVDEKVQNVEMVMLGGGRNKMDT